MNNLIVGAGGAFLGWVVKEVFEYLDSLQAEQKKVGKETLSSTKHTITPVFGKYVTRNQGFKDELVQLRDIVGHYAQRQSVARPLNILLAAEPGCGKTFLIKQLAKSLASIGEVQFDDYYVVSFRSIDDLTAIFHRIQSAYLNERLPLVLFDEVDGKINGRHLLANFLAPMWDGVFHEGKESFRLGKAILVFAASDLVPSPSISYVFGKKKPTLKHINYEAFADKWRSKVKSSIKRRHKKDFEKCRDFLDRIDILLCVPPIHEILTGKDDARMEQIDIVCLMVKKHFENVRFIENAVVQTLVDKIGETASRRSAERSIFCSKVGDDNIFRFSCLPSSDQKTYSKQQDIEALKNQYLEIEIKKPKH